MKTFKFSLAKQYLIYFISKNTPTLYAGAAAIISPLVTFANPADTPNFSVTYTLASNPRVMNSVLLANILVLVTDLISLFLKDSIAFNFPLIQSFLLNSPMPTSAPYLNSSENPFDRLLIPTNPLTYPAASPILNPVPASTVRI